MEKKWSDNIAETAKLNNSLARKAVWDVQALPLSSSHWQRVFLWESPRFQDSGVWSQRVGTERAVNVLNINFLMILSFSFYFSSETTKRNDLTSLGRNYNMLLQLRPPCFFQLSLVRGSREITISAALMEHPGDVSVITVAPPANKNFVSNLLAQIPDEKFILISQEMTSSDIVERCFFIAHRYCSLLLHRPGHSREHF